MRRGRSTAAPFGSDGHQENTKLRSDPAPCSAVPRKERGEEGGTATRSSAFLQGFTLFRRGALHLLSFLHN